MEEAGRDICEPVVCIVGTGKGVGKDYLVTRTSGCGL